MDIAPVGFTGGGLFHSLTYSAQPFYNKGRTTHFFRLSRKKTWGRGRDSPIRVGIPGPLSQGLMEYRELVVVFRKDDINHIARLITYVDIKKGKQPKLITLLTNDFDMPLETIVAIYRRRWQIESLFKQIKQNFPLRYFYGESANAIKIQIWVTLIANLLLSVLQSKLKRRWSFSGLATIVRIVLMYYLDLEKFLNQPDADLNIMLADASESPPESTQI